MKRYSGVLFLILSLVVLGFGIFIGLCARQLFSQGYFTLGIIGMLCMFGYITLSYASMSFALRDLATLEPTCRYIGFDPTGILSMDEEAEIARTVDAELAELLADIE